MKSPAALTILLLFATSTPTASAVAGEFATKLFGKDVAVTANDEEKRLDKLTRAERGSLK